MHRSHRRAPTCGVPDERVPIALLCLIVRPVSSARKLHILFLIAETLSSSAGNIMDPMLQNASSQMNQNHSASTTSTSTATCSTASTSNSAAGLSSSLKQQSGPGATTGDMYDSPGPSCSKAQGIGAGTSSHASVSGLGINQLGGGNTNNAAVGQMALFNASSEYVGMHMGDSDAGTSSSGKHIF